MTVQRVIQGFGVTLGVVAMLFTGSVVFSTCVNSHPMQSIASDGGTTPDASSEAAQVVDGGHSD